ncbi:class I SAM-dependent methyltransferase [Nocardia panacis]|uniref:Class I SAM-dependent methyltransferase n=1 Tax=Nocardia panacis TaxID=2340916 RepID=A0A3A4KBE3_9NOCA|nr:class I SAM-dependent methyltransferase [Nocardia panacis]RJO70760.1 class I SAM-dependent methyltransferase [Nocardia panacis]
MNENTITPERIFQMATGHWAAALLGTGATHSVFTHLAAGATDAEQIAQRARISERGAQALLDGLVGLGLVQVEGGVYRNAPEAAEFLVEGKPGYFGEFAKRQAGDLARREALAEVVTTGIPVSAETSDMPDNPIWEALVPAIAPLSVPSATIAGQRLDLAAAGPVSILDVGGGSGIFSAILLGMNPRARATQLDWSAVNRIATGFVGKFGVGERFRTIDGDFRSTDFGAAEYDVAVYSHIAHQESPNQNIAVFGKFRRALKPTGTLVVNDFVVDDDRSGPPFPLIFNSEMLLSTKAGATWRRVDYRHWLATAGFMDIQFVETPGPATLIFAS